VDVVLFIYHMKSIGIRLLNDFHQNCQLAWLPWRPGLFGEMVICASHSHPILSRVPILRLSRAAPAVLKRVGQVSSGCVASMPSRIGSSNVRLNCVFVHSAYTDGSLRG